MHRISNKCWTIVKHRRVWKFVKKIINVSTLCLYISSSNVSNTRKRIVLLYIYLEYFKDEVNSDLISLRNRTLIS